MNILRNHSLLCRRQVTTFTSIAATWLVVVSYACETRAVELVANFDGGTTAVPDAFEGTAGNGWEAPWNSSSASGANTVVNTVPSTGGPISGGGNYLTTEVTSGNSGAATYTLNRKFASGIEPTNPYRVEFTYRVDEDVTSGASTFTGFEDRYVIAEGQGGMTTPNGSTTNDNFSWSIWGFGGDTDLQFGAPDQIAPNVVRTWSFYNGNSADNTFDANSAAMISTGIPITTGGVYEFTIDVDPASNSWDATVDDGTNSFTQTGMGFRDDDGVKTTLHFFTKRSRLDSSGADQDVRAFSIDGVRISQETAATLLVNRITGDITLQNTGTIPLGVLGYQISSELGALNASPANFKSITNNYDQGNVGPDVIDADDEWVILSDQTDGSNDLSEFQFTNSPGDGATIAAGQSVLLSQGAGAWIPSPNEDDLTVQIVLNDASGTTMVVPVVYEGNADLPLLRSDLNHDGDLSADDWDIFAANNLVDLNGLSAAQQYLLGDLDTDGDNDANDYILFRSDYNAFHGQGAFSAMANSQTAPEPTSLMLVAFCSMASLLLFNRCKQREYNMMRQPVRSQVGKRLACLLGAIGVFSTATILDAQVTANFDGGTSAVPDAFTGTPGDGWASEWTSFSASPANSFVNTVPNSGGPISGGGNYLATEVTSGNSGAATYSLNRDFTDGVDQSAPYQIEFTYRVDEDVTSGASTFTGFEDRYMIAEGPSGMTTLNNGNAGNANNRFSWSIWGFGGDMDLQNGPDGPHIANDVIRTWSFYDGDGSESTTINANSAAMISSGIPITTGGIYEFTIDVYPATNTWDATVDDGTNSFTQTGLNSQNSTGIGTNLNFFTKRSRLDSTGVDQDVRAFSVDGISIGNTPTDFVASINTVTGEIVLRNDTGEALDFSNYTITSPMSALNTAGWTSLSDTSSLLHDFVNPVDGDDPGTIAGDSSGESWTESGGSRAEIISELFLIGSTTLPAGESISLGNAYNTNLVDENISFQFFDASTEGLLPGVVEYVTSTVLAGDYNGDNIVDAVDYAVWREHLGENLTLPNETVTPGVVTSEDYAEWRSNYGASVGQALSGHTAAPEPGALAMLLLGAAGCCGRYIGRK